MNLSAILYWVSKHAFVVAAGVIVFGVSAGVVLGTTSGNGNGGKTSAVQPITEANLDVPATATPTIVPPAVTATAVPIRTSCTAIQGTDYRSNEERDWYQKNCSGTTTAAAASTNTGTSSTAPRPAAAAAPAAPAAPSTSSAQVPLGDRLVIPAAGINADVWKANVLSSAMPDPVGYFNVVTYDFGAGSGLGGGPEDGNVVLSGHVDCGRCYSGGPGIAVLWHARTLQIGDKAQYYNAAGQVFNYEVVSSHSVSSATNFVPIVASGAADMTLITCTGTFGGGEYDQRHVVAFRKVG